MFSQELQRYSQQIWEAASPPVPNLEGLTEAETILCKLAYGTLPVSDTASLPLETVLGFVRHALYLRRNSPFCKDLPEDYFLHFVFYPRVNSENIEDCRKFFYDQISTRLTGLSQTDAVLEVNRWCAEQMTYQSSNERTESPMTAYRSGIGRCGEESTFVVTALRSVGIAARQIYVPFWSHCDDNHAWVEAYVDGKWHFLGACEPEPILNRGWFTDASSRALVACYRRFFDFAGESMASEQCISREGICQLYNVIDHYAPASDCTIYVYDSDGKACPGVTVQLCVVNAAVFCPIASLVSDWEGRCCIRLGHGSVHLAVWSEKGTASADIVVSGDAVVSLTLKPQRIPAQSISFDSIAPIATPFNQTVLSPRQREANEKLLLRCAEMRAERISSYYLPEYDGLDAQWREILRLAAGNAAELYSLYQSASEEERSLYKTMLHTMQTKDYRDTPANLLREHLKAALPFRDEPHFAEEILCPRIYNEMLECWRTPISDAFTEEQKAAFRSDPQSLMTYIRTNYTDGGLRYYPTLFMQPTSSLKLKHTDELGRRLLFVAILRTLGIPSRINAMDEGAEYFRNGAYHRVTASSAAPTAVLRLIPQADKRFVYGNNYTLSRWEHSTYLPLKEPGGEDSFCLRQIPGEYRLITANRLPNGNQLCCQRQFTLLPGQICSIPLELRDAVPEEMLGNGYVEHFQLHTEAGSRVSSETLLNGPTILIYLDVRKEPTEHILNEIVTAAKDLQGELSRGLRLILVLHSPKELTDPTLRKALMAVPEIEVYYDSFTSDVVMLARKLFLEPGVWPLLLVTDASHRGYYGTCGYQVGTVELVMKLVNCISG